MLTSDDLKQIAKLLEPFNKRFDGLEEGQKQLQTDVGVIKNVHGKQLEVLQKDVGVLKDTANRTYTVLKVLATKRDVEEAKAQLLKEIKHRQKPQKAD